MLDPKNHPTLCMLPWASLSIGSLGQVLRCQMSREAMGHLSEEKLVDILNNERFRRLRSKMQAGEWDEPSSSARPGCSPCKVREGEGLVSKRKHWRTLNMVQDLWKPETFQTIEPFDIYHLDLAFNNVCNFKCRMCNSVFSTSWKRDEDRMRAQGFPVNDRQWAFQQAQTPRDYNLLDELREIMPRLKKLRKLEIVGGEPFLIPEFFELIEELKRQQIWQNLEFMVTTNGSLIKAEHLERLSGCRVLKLNISVDATGRLFEYMRSSGACSWETLEKKVIETVQYAQREKERQKQTIWRINLNGAFQIYNMLNTYDFIAWLMGIYGYTKALPANGKERHTFEHRLLINPPQLNAKIAPPEIKAQAQEQIDRLLADFPHLKDMSEIRYLNDISTFLKNPLDAAERTRRWGDFARYTQSLDEIRSEKYSDVIPWLAPYLDSAGQTL